MKDPYLVLGVAKTASQDEIKQAYRKLARKLHPDVNPGNKKAEERFKEVSAAHDVLGDPKRRAAYDEFGADGLREGFDPERARAAQRWVAHGARGTGPRAGRVDDEETAEAFGGFEDLFGDLFGRTRRARAPRKGGDAEARLTLDFMQAIRGGEIPVTLRGERGERTLKVKIPPGIEDGARIRLAGQGQPGAGGAGDLFVDISIRPHPVFKRDGKTLLLDLPVTIGEAVAGARIPVPTPAGDVVLTIPPGSQSGSQLRLKGRGIDGGDMIVTLAVQAPDADSPGARELAQQLDAHYRQDVRRGVRL